MMAQQRHKALNWSGETPADGGVGGTSGTDDDDERISMPATALGGFRRSSGSSVGAASTGRLSVWIARGILLYRRSPRKVVYSLFGVLVCLVLLAVVNVESGRGTGSALEQAGGGAAKITLPAEFAPEPAVGPVMPPRDGEDPLRAAELQVELERRRKQDKEKKKKQEQGESQQGSGVPPQTPAAPSPPPPAAAPAPPAGAVAPAELALPFEIIPETDKERRMQALPWPHGYPPHPNPFLPSTAGADNGETAVAAAGAAAAAALPPRVRELMVSKERARAIEQAIAAGDSDPDNGVALTWTLTPRQACDIELLLNGGFSPLFGFMDRATYESVVLSHRLPPDYSRRHLMAAATIPNSPSTTESAGGGGGDGALWPMPITLDVPDSFVDGHAGLKALLAQGNDVTSPRPVRIALRDSYHNLIALLHATSAYRPDKAKEAASVFGTADTSHPGVQYLMEQAGPIYIGGVLEGLNYPQHFDYPSLRYTPNQVREKIVGMGWPRTVAFQTRNPMHRAHIELTKRAQVEGKAGLLLQPVVGMTKPGDVEASVRVRCYQAIIQGRRHYNAEKGVILALLPLAMRMAGPVEALWHAIIRKNHGASHFIVGRDHAGCKDGAGNDFYGAYDAQQLVRKHEQELGISILTFHEVEYVPSLDQYIPGDQIPKGTETLSISGTKFRAMMARGDPIPAWYSDPGVISILREVSPPLNQRGFALLFTGLSGGGKTTIAHGLISRLGALAPTRRLTFLDGDVVRTHLSKGLGFTLQDRNTNVERIGFVAAEAVKHGGIVLAAPIAPLHEARKSFKKLVTASNGGFFQVYVASSLKTCAQRDVKGLYGIAAAGKTDLTGVSHPYETPLGDDGFPVDLTLDTQGMSVDESVSAVVVLLLKNGYLDPTDDKVLAELTAGEKALLSRVSDKKGAKEAAAPEHPYAARLSPYFTASTKDVVTAVSPLLPLSPRDASAPTGAAPSSPSAAGSGTGRGFCTADWDAMVIDRSSDKQPTLMYGGLPMQSSLAFLALRAAKGPVSSPTTAGSSSAQPAESRPQPPSNVAVFLAPHVSLASGGVYMREQSLTKPLNPAYLSALHSIASVGSNNEQQAQALASTLLGSTASPANASAPSMALVYHSATAVMPTLPPTPLAPEAARVYAAWDLWTRMRWDRAVTPAPDAGTTSSAPSGGRYLDVFAPFAITGIPPAPSAAADAAAPPSEGASGLSSLSFVSSLLPQLYRFDPCFRAAAITGKDARTLEPLALEAAYHYLLKTPHPPPATASGATGAAAKASMTREAARTHLQNTAASLMASIVAENQALLRASVSLSATFSAKTKRFLAIDLQTPQEAARFLSLLLDNRRPAALSKAAEDVYTEAYRELLSEAASAPVTATEAPEAAGETGKTTAGSAPEAGAAAADGSAPEKDRAGEFLLALEDFFQP